MRRMQNWCAAVSAEQTQFEAFIGVRLLLLVAADRQKLMRRLWDQSRRFLRVQLPVFLQRFSEKGQKETLKDPLRGKVFFFLTVFS